MSETGLQGQGLGASAKAETGSHASTEPVSAVSALTGFDPAREPCAEMVEGVNEWLNRASRLGTAQRRVIFALGADWGPSPDHQATKRMWHGITGRGIKRQRGPLYVVEHKHRTDNCWRLNDNGLRLQVALWAAIAMEARQGGDGETRLHPKDDSAGRKASPKGDPQATGAEA